VLTNMLFLHIKTEGTQRCKQTTWFPDQVRDGRRGKSLVSAATIFK
jgi:hypothetical protein